ncbi:protein ecdysoneless homolog [Malania oleifera]|uniref:protein ecdysoneless homolog n=1 Tax=Malania oleifera TaxID=397392 RepID=UPI0025ADBB01|nr:protein ecdysoneless homolog [Malania oleifera]
MDATDSSSSIFSLKNSRLPDDTVFFSIFPDFSLPNSAADASQLSSLLQSLHLQILQAVSPYTTSYIWQHEPFTLYLSSHPQSSCFCSAPIPHFHGKLRFGDNLEDEWFLVFLLFQISRAFPSLSIKVWDTDGEFLLIEAAYHLPRWVNPDNSSNRVFIRCGDLHIVPKTRILNPSLLDSLSFLVNSGAEARASDSVQLAVKNRISEHPDRAKRNVHRVRVRVPVSVAHVLKHEPCLISLAVEGFYDRDIDTMKYAAKMERFLSGGSGEELVQVSVRMSRAMYAQLVQQTFQAPKCYPMPARSDGAAYVEAELGMKIACGFEMMYQQRRQEGLEGKGSAWDAFRESLEKSGYFGGLLPGSKEYKRLMENAEEYYRNSSLFSRSSEMMSAPVRRIDEILALPYSSNDFRPKELPPSDDDSWLYGGEDELNSALLERQKEMEHYELKHKKKQKSEEQQDPKNSSGTNLDDFDLGDIAKSMQSFVHKISSYEGAEVPENRNPKGVDFDMDRFMKDIESVVGHPGCEETGSAADIEEGSSSDMDFDGSEDGSDFAEPSDHNGDGEDAFMHSYSDALNDELKATTLKKSFVRANEQPAKGNEGSSNATQDMGEDFTPVDVDVNLVKSFLESFSSQKGLPGPASNLLGLMGIQLPQDASKDK